MITDRTAIVHDWFQGFHGSERVVDTMRRDLFAPGNRPDIFTFHAAHELLPADLSASIVQESRLARLPGIRQRGHDPGRWRYLLPIMHRYFAGLELSRYDLVVSSSHAFAAHVRPRAGAVHVCYCYTPMRYAWMPELEGRRIHGWKGAALRQLAERLRKRDRRASERPDLYAGISDAVRDRIRRFYGREAVVVHPPVDVHELRGDAEKERGHFVWLHRLVSYKRPDVVAEAFRGLPYSLTMVGIGPMETALRSSLPSNVELVSWLERPDLVRLLERASGFLHVGEEDFGISMVEALAAGTPVIGLAAGGALDIVRPGVDGVLLERASVGSIRSAVEEVAAREWDRQALVARAHEFSREVFAERFLGAVELARAGRR